MPRPPLSWTFDSILRGRPQTQSEMSRLPYIIPLLKHYAVLAWRIVTVAYDTNAGQTAADVSLGYLSTNFWQQEG